MKKSLLFFVSGILIMMVAGIFLAEPAAARHRKRLNQSAQLFSNFRSQNLGISPSPSSSPGGGSSPSSTPPGGGGGSSGSDGVFNNLDVRNRLRVDNGSGSYWLAVKENIIRALKELRIDVKDSINGIKFQINENTKMVIKNNGNVGIGTENPGKKLEVAGGIEAVSLRAGTVNASTSQALILIADYSFCLRGKCYKYVCDGKLSENPC